MTQIPPPQPALQCAVQRALSAWDTTTLKTNGDGMLSEAMEKLRAEFDAAIQAPEGGPAPVADLIAYGYAPGDYMSRCHKCNATFAGADKRAITCRACAEKMYGAALAAHPATVNPDLTVAAPAEGDAPGEFDWLDLPGAVAAWNRIRRAARALSPTGSIAETLNAAAALADAAFKAQPKGPVFLARDVAELLGIGVPELSTALVALGFPQRSQGMAVDPLEALAVCRARAAQAPAPAPSAARLTQDGKLHVTAWQCHGCGHRGIDDGDDAAEACSDCNWRGPCPDEDVCPGCGREGTMVSACPKCGDRYYIKAEADIVIPTAAQAPAVGAELTDEQIRAALEAEFVGEPGRRNLADDLRVARATFAALKGKQ